MENFDFFINSARLWNLKSEIWFVKNSDFTFQENFKNLLWNQPSKIWNLKSAYKIHCTDQKVKSEIWNLKSEGSSKTSWVQAINLKSEICTHVCQNLTFWNLKSEICIQNSPFKSKSKIWNLKSEICRHHGCKLWNLKSEICTLVCQNSDMLKWLWNLKSEICLRLGDPETKIWNLKSEICLDSLRCKLDAVRFLSHDTDSAQ